MIFRKCSIGGKPYNGDITDEPMIDQVRSESPPPYEKKDIYAGVPLTEMGAPGSSTGNSKPDPIQISSTRSDDKDAAPILIFDGLEKPDPLTSVEPVSTARAPPEIIHHFHDEDLKRDLEAAVQTDLDPSTAAHARNLNGFFTVLALCHTVLAAVDPETGKLEYKAQSPDEAALVQAAADMGFVFRGREKEILYLQTPFGSQGPIENNERREGRTTDSPNAEGVPMGTGTGSHVGSAESVAAGQLYEEGTIERYELLDILEFTSARKRMSIILRKLDSEDGRLFLLSKGADNVIFERLKEGAVEDLKNVTERHLAEFAGEGLRTLTLAYKVIGGETLPHFFSNTQSIIK